MYIDKRITLYIFITYTCILCSVAYNIISCLELQTDCKQCLLLPRRHPSLFLIICLRIEKYLNCGFCFICVYDNILYCDNNIISNIVTDLYVHIECIICVTYIETQYRKRANLRSIIYLYLNLYRYI